MTTAVLVPPPPSGAAVNVPTTSTSTKTLSSAGNNNALAENRDGVEERSACDANHANKLSASSVVDAASARPDDHDGENANTANLANITSDANVGAGSVTRAAANTRLKRCKSTPETMSAKKLKKRRRVSFESADIVEFEPTVFTTTVTSGGIPLGMSLTERSRSRRRLDSWELEREDLRVGRQNYMEEGYLDPAERELILNNAGCAEQNMLNVEAEVNQIIAHRRESNETDFDFLYGLVSIGEEGDDDDEDEEDDEEEEEEEEKEDIEEVQLLSSIGSEEGYVLER